MYKRQILHILTHITGFGQGGGIRNGKGYIQHPGQGLCQQGLTHTGGSQQQDIALGKFCVIAAEIDALIVVVNRNGQRLLGIVLTLSLIHIFGSR